MSHILLYKEGNKKFLSDSFDEGGSVCWSVKSSQYKYRDVISETGKEVDQVSTTCADASLKLSDCSRNIQLNFDLDPDQEDDMFSMGQPLEKRLSKVDILIKELFDFRAALIQANQVTETEKERLKNESESSKETS